MFLILYEIDPINQNRSILNRKNFLFNYEKGNLKKTYSTEENLNKVLEITKKLKTEIEKDLNNISLNNNFKDLIDEDFDKIGKYLYELCFVKKKYDDEFLKFLLLLNEKYKNNHELSFLIRFLMDKCQSEIFFKVLLYNRLLKEIYCENTQLSDYDFFFHNPNFSIYKNKFNSLINVLDHLIKKFYLNSPAYKNYELQFDAEDTVAPILKQISYCYFYDKFKRKFYCDPSVCRDDEKSIKTIKQELKDKYIGTERWINQYNLYKNTKLIFKNSAVKVFREFSPPSMGRQRLDVYFEINDQKIAFEYQGEQHYKSVSFFGGDNGFKKRLELDKRKKNICKKLNIKLIKFKHTDSVSINSIIKIMHVRNIKLDGVVYT
jgi:hypothetical protein